MPKVSDAHKEARYNQILEAAIACFAENGFHETKMQDICRESGLSAGAVYSYFRSKEEIIEASSGRDAQARARRYETARRQSNSREAMALLLQYVRQMTQPDAESKMKYRVQLFGESVRNPSVREMQRTIREDNLQNMQAIIRSGQEKGDINPDLDSEALARLCTAIGDGLWVQKILHPDLDVDKYIEAVIAVFEHGFWADRPKETSQ